MAKNKPAKRSFGKSALLTLMHRGLDKLGRLLADSAVVRFFCGYDEMEEYAASSMTVGGSRTVIGNLKKKFSRKPRRELGTEQFTPQEVGIFAPGSLPRSLKNRIGEAVEGSVILTKFVEWIWKLLYMPMMNYGVWLFSFGLFTTVAQALLYFWLHSSDVTAALDLFVGLSIVLLSLLVMFKGYEPMLDTFRESLVGSFVTRMLGDSPPSDVSRKQRHFAGLFFIVGMLCGLLTFVISPLVLIAVLSLSVSAICVFFVPESGVCVLLFTLPFLSDVSVSLQLPAIAILYIGACLLLKVMVGKRSFSFGLTDALVLLFLLIVLSTGVGNGTLAGNSALLYGAMIAGYFVLANLMRSPKWIHRSLVALSISAFLLSVLGIADRFLPIALSIGVLASPMATTFYLLAVIPITLSSMLCQENRSRNVRSFLMLAFEIAYLFLIGSYTGIIALIVELLFFFLFYTRKTRTALVLIILSLPFVSYVAWPDFSALLHRITQSERVQLWKGFTQVFGQAPLSGIGMNDEVLQHALDSTMKTAGADLTLSNTFLRVLIQVGIPGLAIFVIMILLWYAAGFTLLHKCGTKDQATTQHLALLATLTGLLTAGNLFYLWSDPRILLLFWMCAGIARALRRVAKRHEEIESTVPSQREDGVQCVDVELTFPKTVTKADSASDVMTDE